MLYWYETIFTLILFWKSFLERKCCWKKNLNCICVQILNRLHLIGIDMMQSAIVIYVLTWECVLFEINSLIMNKIKIFKEKSFHLKWSLWVDHVYVCDFIFQLFKFFFFCFFENKPFEYFTFFFLLMLLIVNVFFGFVLSLCFFFYFVI